MKIKCLMKRLSAAAVLCCNGGQCCGTAELLPIG